MVFLCLSVEGYAQSPDVRKVTAEDLKTVLEESDASLNVVNFWATWCAPCIEEFPDFMRLGKDLADEGVSVFFVSMDFEEEMPDVEAFLAEQGYAETSYLRTGKDHEFIEGIHSAWSGVLPATFLYNGDVDIVDFWQGKPVGYEALEQRVHNALQP